MSKHTPGPWGVRTTNKTCVTFYIPVEIRRSGGKSDSQLLAIARVPKLANMPWEANARLIAAAPELLEACINLLGTIAAAEELKLYSNDRKRIESARVAIRKATGEGE